MSASLSEITLVKSFIRLILGDFPSSEITGIADALIKNAIGSGCLSRHVNETLVSEPRGSRVNIVSHLRVRLEPVCPRGFTEPEFE